MGGASGGLKSSSCHAEIRLEEGLQAGEGPPATGGQVRTSGEWGRSGEGDGLAGGARGRPGPGGRPPGVMGGLGRLGPRRSTCDTSSGICLIA